MIKLYNGLKPNCRPNSVNLNTCNILPRTFFALVLLFLVSCEENPTKIGNGLLPNYDFVTIKSFDSLRVWSYTNFNDSTRTDQPSIVFLGQINDPYFGTTDAQFVSQVRLGSPWDKLPFAIDSVKLFLSLMHMKGGTAAGYELTLSEIADQIYTDTAYYSNRPVNTTGYTVSVNLPELKADTINDISVKLPVSFGEYLTRDTSKLFYSNSRADFRSFFKGIYFRITPSSTPTLVSLSLASQATTTGGYYNYFVIYMHDENGNKTYWFILDSANPNARYNRFIHDRSTASPDKMIKHVNDGYKDTLSYLQYLNGVYTKLSFPGLESLKNNPLFAKIAVNKARLTIPVYFDGTFYKASKVPPSLRLRYVSGGGRYDVPDYSVDASHDFFNGKLDSVNNVYTFNIVRYVQGYLKDTKGLLKPELEVFQSATDAKNVILKANNSKTPLKFEFTYTKF